MGREFVKIYGLLDENALIRYVGRTVQTLWRRRQAHIRKAHIKTTPPVCAWIRGLLNNGIKPGIVLLDEVAHEQWEDKERYWISFYKNNNLLNMCEGGGGTLGYKHKEDTILRFKLRCGESHPNYGKSWKSLKTSETLKKKYQDGWSPRKGKKHSNEAIAKIKLNRNLCFRQLTEKGRESITTKMTERWKDSEWREHFSQITKGNPKMRTRAKLTMDQVKQIRIKFLDGGRQIDLAKEYEIGRPAIWSIIHNHTWKDLSYQGRTL